jgi:FMN phosphatase YigB (HAD superfamily)
MKKWIILDVMGVIFEVGDDTNDLLIPYIKKLNNNITSNQVNELYINASLGRLTAKSFWQELGFGNLYPKIETNYLDRYLKLDKEFSGIAIELQEHFNLALLSNDISEWSLYLRQKYNLNRFFREIVISGDVGFRKPSDDIYKILLDRLGCNSNDCIFIDDRYKNLLPAMKLGMKVIKFTRENITVEEYKGFNIKSFIELPNVLQKLFSYCD